METEFTKNGRRIKSNFTRNSHAHSTRNLFLFAKPPLSDSMHKWRSPPDQFHENKQENRFVVIHSIMTWQLAAMVIDLTCQAKQYLPWTWTSNANRFTQLINPENCCRHQFMIPLINASIVFRSLHSRHLSFFEITWAQQWFYFIADLNVQIMKYSIPNSKWWKYCIFYVIHFTGELKVAYAISHDSKLSELRIHISVWPYGGWYTILTDWRILTVFRTRFSDGNGRHSICVPPYFKSAL